MASEKSFSRKDLPHLGMNQLNTLRFSFFKAVFGYAIDKFDMLLDRGWLGLELKRSHYPSSWTSSFEIVKNKCDLKFSKNDKQIFSFELSEFDPENRQIRIKYQMQALITGVAATLVGWSDYVLDAGFAVRLEKKTCGSREEEDVYATGMATGIEYPEGGDIDDMMLELGLVKRVIGLKEEEDSEEDSEEEEGDSPPCVEHLSFMAGDQHLIYFTGSEEKKISIRNLPLRELITSHYGTEL